jgi:hypothetical protein
MTKKNGFTVDLTFQEPGSRHHVSGCTVKDRIFGGLVVSGLGQPDGSEGTKDQEEDGQDSRDSSVSVRHGNHATKG